MVAQGAQEPAQKVTRMKFRWFSQAAFILYVMAPAIGHGEEIRVAAASNFRPAMKALAKRFEANTGVELTLIFGSTGKQYAQIRNGAPFDVFLAADTERPALLEQEGMAVAGSRFTYALGKLVLWSPKKDVVDSQGLVLQHGEFRRLAIANPGLAPYGKAAQQTLESLGLWDKLDERLVLGENIGQTFHFVSSGAAELGLVALSQIKHPGRPIKGSYWEVPHTLFEPIEQQAVLLKESAAARQFLEFIRSWPAMKVIAEFGYGAP